MKFIVRQSSIAQEAEILLVQDRNSRSKLLLGSYHLEKKEGLTWWLDEVCV